MRAKDSDIYQTGYDDGWDDRTTNILDKIDAGVCEYCDLEGRCIASECGANEYEAFKRWLETRKSL